jgi:hypothetical protein
MHFSVSLVHTMSKCAWKLHYEWQLGLMPTQYSHNEVTTASCNFCTSFSQEAVTEDVVNPLEVAALLSSLSRKQGI